MPEVAFKSPKYIFSQGFQFHDVAVNCRKKAGKSVIKNLRH